MNAIEANAALAETVELLSDLKQKYGNVTLFSCKEYCDLVHNAALLIKQWEAL